MIRAGCFNQKQPAFFKSGSNLSRSKLTYYPLLVFVISFIALFLAALLGKYILRWRYCHSATGIIPNAARCLGEQCDFAELTPPHLCLPSTHAEKGDDRQGRYSLPALQFQA